jgi:exopolysaccharide biosynthesis polyprenyl glycosylphosphotransferase
MIAGRETDSRRILALSDCLAFLIASLAVCLSWGFHAERWGLPGLAAQAKSLYSFEVALTLLWCLSLGASGAYRAPRGFRGTQIVLFRGSLLFGLVVWMLAPSGWVTSKKELSVALVSAFALTVLFRAVLVPRLRRLAGVPNEVRVLVLGYGAIAARVETVLRERGGYRTVRRTNANGSAFSPSNGTGKESLRSVLATYQPHEVIIAGSSSLNAYNELIQYCRELGTSWQCVPYFDGLSLTDLQANLVGGLPLLTPKGSAFTGLNLRVKQIFDLTFGAVLLVLTLPIMAVVWVAIRLDSPGPAVIVQPRLGYKGKIFNLYKFRTMQHNADDGPHRVYVEQWVKNQTNGGGENGDRKIFKLVDDKRVTRIGHFLRRYSLDELPQIFNVLKLEMSLVGPRPCVAYEAASYQEWHKERLEAVPGLTGLWQVSGRNRLSFNEMVRLDVEYLRNWTPLKDLTVMVKTIPAIFRGTGV